MSLDAIRNALNTKMATISASARIAWENVPFLPKPTESHYRVNFLSAQTRPAANHRSAMDFESGLYQVDVYVPQNEGTGAAGALVEAVRALFYRGLTLAATGGITVHIAAKPSVVFTAREGAFWRTQIDVPWFSYTPNGLP
jgi:hypothetical protein